MSQANVDVVRSSFEAFARGDFGDAFSSYDPGTEWCTAVDEPDQRTYRGLAALTDFVESLAEPWVDRFGATMKFEDFIDGGDWVVVPRGGVPDQGASPRSPGAVGLSRGSDLRDRLDRATSGV
jgi:ketosteroid isomerase-like protein